MGERRICERLRRAQLRTAGRIAPAIAGYAAKEQLRRANRQAHDRTGSRRSLRRESQTLRRRLYQRREELCHPAQRAIRPDETAPIEQLLFLDVLGFSHQPPESNDRQIKPAFGTIEIVVYCGHTPVSSRQGYEPGRSSDCAQSMRRSSRLKPRSKQLK